MATLRPGPRRRSRRVVLPDASRGSCVSRRPRRVHADADRARRAVAPPPARHRPRHSHHRRRRTCSQLRGPARRDPRRPQLRRHGDHRCRRPRRRPDRPPRLPRRRQPDQRPVAGRRRRADHRDDPAPTARSSTASSSCCSPRPAPAAFYGVTDPDDLAWIDARLTAPPVEVLRAAAASSSTRTPLGAIPQYHIVCTENLAHPRPPSSWIAPAPRGGSGRSTPATT